MWRCLNQQRRSSSSHESISSAKGSSSGDSGTLPTAGGLSERSGSLRYFLTVGSETPVSRAIEATVAPFLPSFLISSILSTPIISSLAPNRRNRSNDNGRPNGMVGVPALRPETFSRSFPKNHRARTRKTGGYQTHSSNPCRRAESMGSKSAGEMRFWTKDQYLRFSDEIMDKPLSFHAFETLYWCGVREGELLALKPRRFDFERGTLTVAESYQRIDGQDVLTDPKTPKSKRVIAMPHFYAEEMEAFLSGRGLDPDERIFPVTKYFLSHEMARGSKAAGLEPIRIHDLRHSHVSLLIDMGFTALAIADRMGHEAADITYRYAHLFPSVQADMARALDGARREN